MGFKRPFDEEEFQELPLKHPKQVDCGNKLTSFADVYPSYEPTHKADIPGDAESLFCKSHLDDGIENDNINLVSDMPEKELEISAPLSWVTSSTSEEDAGSGAAVCSAFALEYCEYFFPRRSVVQFEDTSPRKQVPVGPNHQAELPEWDPHTMEKFSLCSDCMIDTGERKVMGESVIVMPDRELSANSDVEVGYGRKACLCPDEGSVRCVQQHVKEARERVRESLGHEKFVQLGFCDMGEEVSQKWTEEEEQVFHEVVYSNPVSHGKKFWENLSVVFPSRTKSELVSYYFNVFILRRRATQNRSNFLEIDSDDDEWQGSLVGPVGVAEEDEDSVDESLVDQDIQGRNGYDSAEDDNGNCDDDGNDDGDDDDDSDCDDDDNLVDKDGNKGDNNENIGNGGNITDFEVGNSFLSTPQIGTALVDHKSEFVVHNSSKIFVTGDRNFDAQNASCIAFECQECDGNGGEKEGGRLHSNVDGSTDGFSSGYLLEPCDVKVYDVRYPLSPLVGFDLLPTGNVIEEIFGPSTQNGKLGD
ncbi:hypothetical protein NMG60_11009313 [Bertholletia excelsa]